MRLSKIFLLAGGFAGGTLACILPRPAAAQTSAVHWQPAREASNARDLFAAEHYGLAADAAERFLNFAINPVHSNTSLQRTEAAYIRMVSRLRTDAKGAESDALIFLKETTDPVFAQRAHLALARWYFGKERLAEAIPHYRAAGIENLSNAEVASAKFELAYALFNNRQFTEATALFLFIREVEGPYRSAGNYYHGLLAYNAGDYAEALKSFERIDEEPLYRGVVPYYIAELHYYSGDQKKALADALRLMQRPEKLYYDTELHLLAAQVLFEEARYADALPYFEFYYNKTGKLRKEELYEMAYSHYRVEEWSAAIEKFKPLSAADDSLGQTAMYLLGDCYLKTGDKRGALAAFRLCADAPHVPAQREAAMLLAAKLAYEAGYDAEATTRVTALLTEFPSSARKGEALTFRSELFLRGAQYEEALASLLNSGDESSAATRLRQRATYGLALQKMSAGHLTEADKLLNDVTQLAGPDPDYNAAALFWRAEIAYRQERYTDAAALSEQFAGSSAAITARRLGPSISLASSYLTAGHAAFQLEKFGEAERFFGRSLSEESGGGNAPAVKLRQADAAMMQRDYTKAASLYDAALRDGATGAEADYARLQKAIILGLRGENGEKARLLQSLVDKGVSSQHAIAARYELALTRLAEDRPREAIVLLTPLTQGTGLLVPKALLRLGFAHAEAGNDSLAMAAYRRVVLEYPGSDERAAALDGVRGLSVERGLPEEYADLLQKTGLTDYSAILDSTYYAAAERVYERQSWSEAVKSFDNYLAAHPTGLFSTKAFYYKGRSIEMARQPRAIGAIDSREALQAYDSASARPLHTFSEAASARGAALAETLGDNLSAEKFYQRLRNSASGSEGLQTAYLGLARSAASRADWALVALLADTLLTLPDSREAVRSETALLRGRAMMMTGNSNGALEQFAISEVSAVASIAAESRYRRAEALLGMNKLKEAEAAADAAIRKGGDDRWVLRSYLLIADVLVAQKDYFNAKATLQSVAKNAKDATIRADAAARLARVTELEKAGSKLQDETEEGQDQP